MNKTIEQWSAMVPANVDSDDQCVDLVQAIVADAQSDLKEENKALREKLEINQAANDERYEQKCLEATLLRERAEKAEAALEQIKMPMLATAQPCGCQLCVCPYNEENRCNGCGAHACNTADCVMTKRPDLRVYEDAPSYGGLLAKLLETEGRLEKAEAACALLKDQLKRHGHLSCCDRRINGNDGSPNPYYIADNKCACSCGHDNALSTNCGQPLLDRLKAMEGLIRRFLATENGRPIQTLSEEDCKTVSEITGWKEAKP